LPLRQCLAVIRAQVQIHSVMRPLLVLLALASCTSASPAENPASDSGQLAGRFPGPPKNCITMPQGEHLIALDESTLVYRSGKTLWVTHPIGPCGRLDGISTLLFEQSGTQVCRGDRVRVIERPLTAPGPICTLREFIPYRKP